MSVKRTQERRLLIFSSFSSLLFALMGIGLGAWLGSLVIMFDGAYSLASLALSVLSLWAAWIIRQYQNKKKPDWINIVEPGVITIKGSVILLMCLVSLGSAIHSLLNGGRDVDAGWALGFGVVNVIGCSATIMVLYLRGKGTNSALLQAEIKQWLMDTVISVSVLLGFAVAAALSLTAWSEYAVYADPLMVMIASAYFMLVPITMVRRSVSQIHFHFRQQECRD